LYNTAPQGSPEHGSAAIGVIGHEPILKGMWFRGGWFDPASALWREVSTGRFTPNDGNTDRDLDGYNGGSLLVGHRLKPGESITIPVILAWHFPNRSEGSTQAAPPERPQPACSPNAGGCGGEDVPAWRTWYATQWT